MTDTTSPTSQFHPYQKPDAVPVAERQPSQFERGLRKLGVEPDRIRSATGRGMAWARKHPGAVVGGLAAAVIGAGLLRSRVTRPGASKPSRELSRAEDARTRL